MQVEQLCDELSGLHPSFYTTDSQLYMVGGTIDWMEGPRVKVEHEKHSNLQALTKKYDLKVFYFAHILHYRDHEMPLLETPLKDQYRATCDIVEHNSCGATNMGVYALKN